MPKLSWNTFTEKHPESTGFVARFSARLPGQVLDGSGKKLPTPYGLLCEALGKIIKGDWAAMTVPAGGFVKVVDAGDVSTVGKNFGAHVVPDKVEGCTKVYRSNYGDSDYWKVAEKLGYEKEGLQVISRPKRPVQKGRKRK